MSAVPMRSQIDTEERLYDMPVVENLMDHLKRLNLRLQRAIAGRVSREAGDVFSFAAVTDAEVQQLLQEMGSVREGDSGIDDALRTLDRQIAARERASLTAGARLRLRELQAIFSLSDLELDVLVACAAPELDRRYERVYGYLHDDMTRKLPSVGLLLSMLCEATAQRAFARAALVDPSAGLIRYRLVQATDDVSGSAPWSARSLRVDERIIAFMLGADEPDYRIRDIVESPKPSDGAARMSADQTAACERVRFAIQGSIADGRLARKPVFYLQSAGAGGDDLVVGAAAESIGLPLLIVDAERLTSAAGSYLEGMFFCLRESLLRQAGLYVRGADCLFEQEVNSHGFGRLVADMGSVVFLSGEKPWSWGLPPEPLVLVPIELAAAGYAEQMDIWRGLAEGSDTLGDSRLHELVSRYPMSVAEINRVWGMARSLAALRGGELAPTEQDVVQACRTRSRVPINGVARRIEPKHRWEDIVLPAEQREQLRTLCNQAKYRSRVYGEWGFEDRLSLGKGLAALFAGPPGTGKTMAAEVIAHELGMDLYKIDLSQIVSKYIGETEKNLRQIFDQAGRANAILFFDEADALLGKRSAVKDAHDRYANTEVAYLLQKMEEYEGIAVLATNLRQNLDEAFTRRLRFIIELPVPDEAARAGIWRQIWPSKTPLAKDFDPELLGRRFKISGGSIRNIALGAAFAAAERGASVDMALVMESARRELRKMGRLVDETGVANG